MKCLDFAQDMYEDLSELCRQELFESELYDSMRKVFRKKLKYRKLAVGEGRNV